jgi:CubicO group peptidase (beta-lactamase class C family)
MKQTFLTARSDKAEAAANHAEQPCVPWWSFTKTALAAAALQLVAQKRLGLDEAFDNRPFTLRQLLQHRAGLPDYGDLPSYHAAVQRGEKPWHSTELLDRVGADRLDFEPGHGWRYSNIGYFLVRRQIEKAARHDIGAALRHLVFDPLGLESVHLLATPGDLADTAWGNRAGYDPGWVYHGLPAGTAADAARFLHQLMSGDVLPRELLTEMTTSVPLGGPYPVAHGRP